MNYCMKRFYRGLAPERRLTGEQLIQNRCRCKYQRRWSSAQSLPRLVRAPCRPEFQHFTGEGQAGIRLETLSQAKIGHLRQTSQSIIMFAGLRSRWRMPRWWA